MPTASRTRVRRLTLAALVASVGITVSGQGAGITSRFPASTYLDEASVREAIDVGRQRKPEPYWLYPKPGVPESSIAVYTPFIRVALAAHAAGQRGERLSIESLPKWLTDRVAIVVVRPADSAVAAARQLFPNDPPLRETPITQIALEWRNRAPFLQFIAPKWMTTDLSFLDDIGGLPFPDAVAAAAFEPELLLQDVDVWGWWRKEKSFFPSLGKLDPNEVRSWR